MSKKLIIVFVVVFCAIIGGQNAEAKRVRGYIITNENDTLQGYLSIYNTTVRTLTISFTKRVFNAEMAFVEAPFKQDKHGFYKNYTPDELKEYGFTYKGVPLQIKVFYCKIKYFYFK